MDRPPPGAPELATILAPVILPLSAASKVCAGAAPASSLAEMVATELAAFLLFTVVARPVTITSSSLAMSSSSTTCSGAEGSAITVADL